MEQGVRMIALGNPEGSDKASQLIAIASSLGLKSSIVTSNPGENFELFMTRLNHINVTCVKRHLPIVVI